MVSTRSPACAHVLALLATSLLAVPHVAAESNQGELAARTPNGKPSFYSTFLAQNDVACCPTGTTEKYSGPCCATGLVVSQALFIFSIMGCVHVFAISIGANNFLIVC